MQIRLIRPVSEWRPFAFGHRSVETISRGQSGDSLRPEKARSILVIWILGRRAATIDEMERKIDDGHQSPGHCGTIIYRLASRMRNVVQVDPCGSRSRSVSTSRPQFYEPSWMSKSRTQSVDWRHVEGGCVMRGPHWPMQAIDLREPAFSTTCSVLVRPVHSV